MYEIFILVLNWLSVHWSNMAPTRLKSRHRLVGNTVKSKGETFLKRLVKKAFYKLGRQPTKPKFLADKMFYAKKFYQIIQTLFSRHLRRKLFNYNEFKFFSTLKNFPHMKNWSQRGVCVWRLRPCGSGLLLFILRNLFTPFLFSFYLHVSLRSRCLTLSWRYLVI